MPGEYTEKNYIFADNNESVARETMNPFKSLESLDAGTSQKIVVGSSTSNQGQTLYRNSNQLFSFDGNDNAQFEPNKLMKIDFSRKASNFTIRTSQQ